jgi:predicted peroxiredoxin
MGPLIVFITRADYEAMHLGLSAALAAASLGRKVELFFFWFALERLAKGRMIEADVRPDIADLMERRQVPTLDALYAQVRGSGLATCFACSGSLAAIGVTPAEIEPHVDALIGWVSILQRTSGAADRLTF